MKNKRGQTQPAQQPVVAEKKKSKWWIWILVILVLVVVGIGVYFVFFSGGSDGGILSNLGGNSIPKPPALPE